MTTMAPLSEVTQINPRIPQTMLSTPRRTVHFIPMSELSEDGYVNSNGTRPLEDVVKGYTYFENGDVLVAKITPCMENGKAAFVTGLEHGIAFGSTEFHVLRPKSTLDGKYLFYMIWNPEFRHAAESRMTGSAGQKRVPKSFLERFEIPFPKLDEQKRVAAILDKANAIRRKRRNSLHEIKQLLRASFFTILGDPIHGDFPTRKPLGKVASVSGGFAFKSDWFTTDATKLIRISNISNGVVDTSDAVSIDNRLHGVSDSYKAKSGDVLMALSGATTGKTGVVLPDDDGAFVNQRIAIIRSRTPGMQSYLRVLLTDDRLVGALLRTAGGSAQENLSPRVLTTTEIGIPSETQLDMFHKVERQVLQTTRKIEVEASTEADDLFNSLVRRAVKGEL